MAQPTTSLDEISPDKIRQNPDNPRLIFREGEMNQLLESIREVGIKVPISLYEDGSRYVLIDGERRWRCAKRLNLHAIPAIIQPKPSKLENLLMMFNIHNVRVAWDIMPMALKLREVQDMISKQGQVPSPKALSAITGVPLTTIRRALELLELPLKYQRLLLREGEKPRSEQRIKADLFLEVYKSLHAVERYAPEVLKVVPKVDYINAMVRKYMDGVVDNVVSYRDVSRIARAELAGVGRDEAIPVLVKLVRRPAYSIKQAFADTVQVAYERRDLLAKLSVIAGKLHEIRSGTRLPSGMQSALRTIRTEIDRLLG